MRRTIMVLAAAAGVVLTTGCANSPQQVAGQAAPVGAVSPVPATAASSSAVVPSAVTTSAAAPSATPASRPSSSPTPKKSFFGPIGVGQIKIGMSIKKAQATGDVANVELVANCGTATLVAAGDYQNNEITYSSDKGLVFISGYPKITTPEGIRIGSTLAQVKAAYSDFEFRIEDADPSWTGTGGAFAGREDEYDGAHYRFEFEKNKVTQLGLEHDEQNCYE